MSPSIPCQSRSLPSRPGQPAADLQTKHRAWRGVREVTERAQGLYRGDHLAQSVKQDCDQDTGRCHSGQRGLTTGPERAPLIQSKAKCLRGAEGAVRLSHLWGWLQIQALPALMRVSKHANRCSVEGRNRREITTPVVTSPMELKTAHLPHALCLQMDSEASLT